MNNIATLLGDPTSSPICSTGTCLEPGAWWLVAKMPDISKRLEKADKYLQKGKQDAALVEYLEALREDPTNETVRQTAAELCIAVGRTEEARRLLLATFDRYSSTGDVALAAAAFKKLSRLGPPPVAALFRYAQLIEKNSRKEALEAYQGAVVGFANSLDKPRALMALRQVVRLDASVENLTRLGALAADIGDRKTASAAYMQVAQQQEEASVDALDWYGRAYEMDHTVPEVTLAYGRALLNAGRAAEAIEILAPVATSEQASPLLREAYGRALLADNRLAEAEPFLWQLFQADPAQIQEVAELIGAFLDAGQPAQAVDLARKLEKHQRRAGNHREFVALIKSVSEKHVASAAFLEYMAEVYNGANREADYCATLIELFELYYAAGNYLKSASSLDRAAEVDAYEPGHERRLEMLRGKVDAGTFNTIASRLTAVMRVEQQQEHPGDGTSDCSSGESNILEDLMLQAEIYLQYSMRSKALERLERIRELFPREEEKTTKLRELYLNAGFVPQYDSQHAPPAPPSADVATVVPAAPPRPAEAAASADNQVESFARITEITRNIYRQGTVKGVLFTAVNDIGRHWDASRCVAGLLTPGKPPSAALEYCAPGVPPSEVIPLVKLVVLAQALAVEHGVVSRHDISKAPEFDPIREHVQALGIRSILAVPLLEGDEAVGVIILQQCNRQRRWRPSDEAVLRTIADQMVLAVNNAKLRSLVRTLAVTEEKSGLLKRSSYLDVLLSETKRALQQKSTSTVMLMHFGKPSSLARELGEPALENLMEQVGQIVTSHIRQNDVAVRYELTTVALILADTPEKNAFFVVDKLRKLLAGIRVPGRSTPLSMTVGIAEAVMDSRWDPVDIVTEVINRVEAALEAAKADGGNKAAALPAQLEGAAAGV